ncbi:PaaX family transcriptional regulator, partial [Candidatus Acidianus copahuensis]
MKPQTLIFTLFGDYINNKGGTVSVRSLIKMMKPFGLSEQATRAAVSRLKQKGLLENVNSKGSYKLSEEGLVKLTSGVRRVYFKTKHPWDKKWRIIVYNIPESKRELRDKIRKELRWLGFGMLAQSTWISPNPIEDYVNNMLNESWKDVRDSVHFFISTYLGDPKALVNLCSDIKGIENAYKTFIEKWKNVKDEMSEEESFVMKIRLVHEYRKFLHIDPDLPADLLP